MKDLNIASSEYRINDIELGRGNRSAAWTALLLLNFFAGRGSSVGRASTWYGPVADSILIGHEIIKKILRPFFPFRWFKNGKSGVSYWRKNVH